MCVPTETGLVEPDLSSTGLKPVEAQSRSNANVLKFPKELKE